MAPPKYASSIITNKLRYEIKARLPTLRYEQIELFLVTYGCYGVNINDIVDNIPDHLLDRALRGIKNTQYKNDMMIIDKGEPKSMNDLKNQNLNSIRDISWADEDAF